MALFLKTHNFRSEMETTDCLVWTLQIAGDYKINHHAHIKMGMYKLQDWEISSSFSLTNTI